MDFAMKALAIIVCASLLIRKGESIRCFQCSSANNSACANLATYGYEDILRPEDCGNTRQYFCRKIIQQVVLPHGWKPEVRVTRGCGWVEDRKHRDCYKADNDDHFETVCQCETDGCNHAPGLGMSFARAALVPIAVVVFKFFSS